MPQHVNHCNRSYSQHRVPLDSPPFMMLTYLLPDFTDFHVYHREDQLNPLLVLQGTVGAQSAGVVQNQCTFRYKFHKVCHCQKLRKLVHNQQSQRKNERVQFSLENIIFKYMLYKYITAGKQ